MSILPASVQQLQDSLTALSLTYVAVVESAQNLSLEPAFSWTANFSAIPFECAQCGYRVSCRIHGDPALRRSVTHNSVSLAS